MATNPGQYLTDTPDKHWRIRNRGLLKPVHLNGGKLPHYIVDVNWGRGLSEIVLLSHEGIPYQSLWSVRDSGHRSWPLHP